MTWWDYVYAVYVDLFNWKPHTLMKIVGIYILAEPQYKIKYVF